MAIPDGAAQVFSAVTRICPLSPTGSGAVAVGANCYVTDQLLKATFTPSMETGVDLVQINANGDIATAYKHGDMVKYYTMEIEVNTPDPFLHNLLAGGTILSDTSTALATPGTVTATPSTSGGVLAAGTYAYKVTAANQYGETLASAEATATTTGSTGSVGLSVATVTGAVYYRWYGRTTGAEQFIAQTTAASYTDTGAITPLGNLPTANTTAGPGAYTGYQSAGMFVPGNHYGVSVEFWADAIIRGAQTTYLPYWRWVIPAVTDLHENPRTFGPSLMPNMYTGICRENSGWGSGGFGDWQFDSSKVFQYARAAVPTVPTIGLQPVAATS